MTQPTPTCPCVAIACGGTGGHLFPGMAVAEELTRRSCKVLLLISPKEVDQRAVKAARGIEVRTLPAIGLARGQFFRFLLGFRRSYRAAKQVFGEIPPRAVLAMGGFTSAPAILAGKHLGARTFLHESNTIPGRANRWLARWVDQIFVGFPSCAKRFHNPRVLVTGTPVRPEFRPGDIAQCRQRLGLDPARPVVLVVGGSQGASGLNRSVTAALPILVRVAPEWQWVHLTGERDQETVRQAYQQAGAKAMVLPFCAEMHQVLGAATAAVSRAGASALSELAALRVPALLVPFPAATDDHQWHNAQAFADSGAARLLPESAATPEHLVQQLREIVESDVVRSQMQNSLSHWHAPQAAEEVALAILKTLGVVADEPLRRSSFPAGREHPNRGSAEGQPRTQTASYLEFA